MERQQKKQHLVVSRAWGGVLCLSWIGLTPVNWVFREFIVYPLVNLQGVCCLECRGGHLWEAPLWKPCTTQPFESNSDKPLSTKSSAHCVEHSRGIQAKTWRVFRPFCLQIFTYFYSLLIWLMYVLIYYFVYIVDRLKNLYFQWVHLCGV